MKKWIVSIVLLAMVVAGCSQSSNNNAGSSSPSPSSTPSATASDSNEKPKEPQTIVMWHTYAEHHEAALQAILDEFNNSQDWVTVTAQSQPLTDYESKLMQAVRNRTGPDVILTFPTVVANYIDDGFAVELGQYIEDPEIGIPGYKESLPGDLYDEATQWGGGVYMMPLLAGGEVFFYNKTLLDSLGLEVPTTWTQLEEAGRIIAAETGKPAFGFDAHIDGFQVLIMQAGSSYIDRDSKTVAFNNDIAVEKLNWFADLVKEGVFRLVGEDVYFSNPFGSEQVASYLGSALGYGFVVDAVGEKFELGVAPIPQEGVRDYVSSWGSNLMIFSSNEEKQKAAFEFLKFLTTPEMAARFAVEFNGVPAYDAAIQQPSFQAFMEENQAMKAQSQQLDRIGYLPAIKGSASVRTEIGAAVEAVVTGLKTAEQALADAEAASNRALQQ